jgi:hypothetical protein
MTTEEMVNLINEMFYDRENEGDFSFSRIETFEQAGLVTRDQGLVITLDRDTQFQITIQDSSCRMR